MRCSNEAILLPTPWLPEDTAPNGPASYAIGEPISMLDQLQSGGCTQLRHLNEAMPFRTAGRSSSSLSHRRAPTYLRRSHMPLCTEHRRLSLQWQHSVASGCPPEQKVRKDPDFAVAGIATNEWRDMSAAAFCCDALSRPPMDTTGSMFVVL